MERRIITIAGTVQGVGFRPFVYTLARKLDLVGNVRNQMGGVRIEIEGDSVKLDELISQLTAHPPPLARIDECTWESVPLRGDRTFQIDTSIADAIGTTVITTDAATCDDCIAELFNPSDRRYRYPFLNCTNCGPRLTIVTGAPYDRHNTTMAGFAMCPSCRAEYENPADRRFHAQPTACSECGPRLSARDSSGAIIDVADPLAWFVAAIVAGKIGAMKGLGGYHLVCDARNESAVAELRRRKHRDEKPFAVMVGDLKAAEHLCEISPPEAALLKSARRPIVLLLKKNPFNLPLAIAPGNPYLGVMLPYTPLHYLLLHDIASPLVMTSGNRSDEPIAYEDADAIDRLRGIADLFLTHDRPIHVRCDDSVTRVIDGIESPIRRSRGYAPQPIPLPISCPEPILAVGGQLKGTFALGSDRRAVISHHLGDLDHIEAYRAFERDVSLYEKLFSLRPVCMAHDLHPDYASTRYALRRSLDENLPHFAVQHHHAHLASCMVEHGLTAPTIGVIFDGTGFGMDGAVWGGEFLIGDYRSFRRAAHLRYVGMPGADAAVREPWRMAVSHLADAGASCASFERRIGPEALRLSRRMLERRLNCPLTSSAGRLFDAVASLIGIRDRTRYEGQAAIELEWLATQSAARGIYPFSLIDKNAAGTYVVDTRPLIAEIAHDVNAGVEHAIIARQFQSTVVAMITRVCAQLRADTGIEQVVLSGGVFMNALLVADATEHLRADGHQVFRHQLVPPNDGGLSLGQLAIAAAHMQMGSAST